jgi:hypothetical protein
MIENLNSILDQFGGKKDVFFGICFIVVLFFICSLIKQGIIRFIISFFSAIFVVFQFISLFFNQSFVGYQFYVHLNLRATASVSGFFVQHILFSVLMLILLILFFYKSRIILTGNLIKKIIPKKIVVKFGSIFLAISVLIFIFLSSDFLSDSKSLATLFISNDSEGFKELLEKQNMNNYISPDKIESKRGKNIIVLSLESLEKGFLSPKFKELTPNLNKLKKEWNYYDLNQNEGSNWTSGSLYTYLTGFPAYFGAERNKIFQKTHQSSISSISHVLNNCDYKTVYLNGDTDHSGVIDMLNTFKFDKVIDRHSLIKTESLSHYGVRDKDLFELAKIEIKNLVNDKENFALFLSTTDTHFPDGIYDDRMEHFVQKRTTDLEFMVSALDYMIGDFIDYLEANNLLENTVVYIFPDHLKMGDPSIFENTGERGLYLLSNGSSDALSIDTTKDLYQIDLAKIILNGAEVKHNLSFLTDYISGDKNQYIIDNSLELTMINTSGLRRYGGKIFKQPKLSENYEQYKKDTSRYIAHAGGKIDGHIYTNCKEALDLSYKKGFRFFELDIGLTSDGEYIALHDWSSWADMTNYKGEYPVSEKEFLNQKLLTAFTPMNMDSINKWFCLHPDAFLITDKINDPIKFSELFIDKKRLKMELFDTSAINLGLKTNINSVIVSESVLKFYDYKDMIELKKKGVHEIAVSRKFIESNKPFLLLLKEHGVNVFVFHVNFEPGIDENYVTKFELDFVYGLYADDWYF